MRVVYAPTCKLHIAIGDKKWQSTVLQRSYLFVQCATKTLLVRLCHALFGNIPHCSLVLHCVMHSVYILPFHSDILSIKYEC